MSHGHALSFIPRSKKHSDDLKQRHKFYNIIKGLKKKQQSDWTYETHLKIIELECRANGQLDKKSRQKAFDKDSRKERLNKKRIKNKNRTL